MSSGVRGRDFSDIETTGPTPEEWWHACRIFMSLLNDTHTWFWTQRDKMGELCLMEGMHPELPFGSYPLVRLGCVRPMGRLFKASGDGGTGHGVR